MDYPAYPVYRESGIEWLGNIPDHWEVRRLKFVAEIQNGRDYKEVESSEGYPVFGSGGVFRFATEYLYDGESVLFGRKGTIDKPLYVNEKFWTVDTMFYSVILEQTHGRFLYFFATTLQFNLLATQTALPSITQTDLGNYLISYPTYQEQQTIAQFLDHKTQQIDQLIAKKQTLIDKLNEQRIALITHAVTKGLNPAVTLVDSGVEWLGKVPEHWEIGRKFGFMSKSERHSFVNGPFGSDLLTSELMKEGIPVIYSGDVKDTGFRRKSDKYVTEDKALELNFCRVDSGDLLLSKVGDPPGLAGVYPSDLESGIVTQDVVRVKIDSNIATSQYLTFLINSAIGKFLIKQISVEATRGRFSLGDLKRLTFILPPTEEQEQIVEYLNEKNSHIDRMVALNQQTIDKLKEYRTALITAAVTGKIDLRNWQQEANHAV